jgi:hypothetical protein
MTARRHTRVEPRRPEGDLGLQVVAELRRRCGVDEEWSLDQHRGFRWWPHQQAQSVWSEPAFDDGGLTVWRIHVRTDVLRGFRATDEHLEWLRDTFPCGHTFSGVVSEGRRRDQLWLAASAWVHEQSFEWVTDLLGWVVLVQAAEARGWASHAEACEVGVQAVSAHPLSGVREVPDETMQVVRQLIQPAGALPSPWAGEELPGLVEFINRPPCVLATGGPRGLTAEFPFGRDTSLLRVFPEDEHAVMGTGLRIELTVPVPNVDTVGALDLNARELRHLVRAPFLGGWHAGDCGYVWTGFYPNALQQDGFLTNLVLGTVARSKWVAEEVYGHDWSKSFEQARAAMAARLAALAAALEEGE